MDNIENNISKINIDTLLNSIKNISANEISEELKLAVKYLRKYKLYDSAKWASELLLSTSSEQRIKHDSNITSPFSSENNSSRNLNSIFNRVDKQGAFSNSLIQNNEKEIYTENNYGFKLNIPINKSTLLSQTADPKKHLFKIANIQDNVTTMPPRRVNINFLKNQFLILKQEEACIKDTIHYASTLFDIKEFRKCSFVLKPYAKPKFQTAMFLYFFSEYNLIEQKKQEEMLDTSDIGSKTFNSREYVKLQQNLEPLYQKEELDAFNLYLYAIILKELNLLDASKAALIKCLNLFPYLWSAWVELSLLSKQSEMKMIFGEIQEHWMKNFMIANFLLEKNHEIESISLLNSLLQHFNNSYHILNSLAHAYYLMHEYDNSKEYFEKLLNIDPCRYENLDTYSNILFIKENFCELANLAYRCYQNDKYRPETCCIIGNYYSLKNDHVKAIIYFKRAIKLDFNFLSAWTLMGHEFLEMKNIPSAIESYRTAVDIDNNDYRAWYGLGQTYEIHQMYQYAIYYFLNAANAKPNDSRMWTALASCYEKLEKKSEAIKCYKKALAYKDKEGIALYKIAKLYASLGEDDKAASFFEENLKKCTLNNEEIESSEYIDTSIFLAKYYKNKGKFDTAYNYLIKLKDYEGQEKDDIHSMMREINNINSALNNN